MLGITLSILTQVDGNIIEDLLRATLQNEADTLLKRIVIQTQV
jgi:hypothetical protein